MKKATATPKSNTHTHTSFSAFPGTHTSFSAFPAAAPTQNVETKTQNENMGKNPQA